MSWTVGQHTHYTLVRVLHNVVRCKLDFKHVFQCFSGPFTDPEHPVVATEMKISIKPRPEK